MFEDVKRWHEEFGALVNEKPTQIDLVERGLRLKLMWEELMELEQAMNERDLVGVADGIADLIWVACGTAVSYGIPLPECWEEVRKSNFAKKDVDGRVIRREDGKILKPVGWEPPDIEGVITRSLAE